MILRRMRLLIALLLFIGICPFVSAKSIWVQPEDGDVAPAWGFADGIRVGLFPQSMRGLLHVYTPYLGKDEKDVMNFIAIEPIVKGSVYRGFSELEMSSLDGVHGKRIWTSDTIDDNALIPSNNITRGIVSVENGVEVLAVYFIVEPYDNGAKVYLQAKFYADKPYEVELSTFSYGDSLPLENCIVTATMGNYARLRTLWLQTGNVNSHDIWPDFKENDFAPHAYFGKDIMFKDNAGYPYFIASPDEKNPEKAEYVSNLPEWWKYRGRKATQYWYCKTPASDLNGIVNGRVVYWGDLLPIPGGISFENFEMKQVFRQGDRFVFGIAPETPEKFVRTLKNNSILSFSSKNVLKEVYGYVSDIEAEVIDGVHPKLRSYMTDDGQVKVSLSYDFPRAVRRDDIKIKIRPAFNPTFHWAPHLTPTDNHVIAQHVFRNPAMIMQGNDTTLTMIISPENKFNNDLFHYYADMDAQRQELILGISKTIVTDHVLYEKAPGMEIPAGILNFEFYLKGSTEAEDIRNPFRHVAGFFWDNYGHQSYRKEDFSLSMFNTYCDRTYKWAFDSWRDAVWQEFDIDGNRVGAPVFIVDVSQSPNHGGPKSLREDCSIWNQAWFSSIRSASGLYRYAKRIGNDTLMQKALMAKDLALSAPKKDGLFYAVVATPTVSENYSGHKVSVSGGWENLYWGNSNRNPVTWDLEKSPFHILDMSWTAFVMLDWYDKLEKDRRLMDYVTPYADKLVSLQFDNGYFPAWIDVESLEILPYLTDSPESSMSAWFLLKMYSQSGEDKYKEAALRSLNMIMKDVIPAGRWEDFETYWSCCRWGADCLPGKKVKRNNMYKQCNFSMYWTAGALLEAYRLTSDVKYLHAGQRVVDEMLMTQSTWQPPFIYVDVIGGFGVLNTDGEWNDARASLISELLLDYGRETGNPEYSERGMMALKRSFTMMYCPENPKTRLMWEKTWPFFGEEDYGFLMENYGHAGTTSEDGDGMGNFTIFDWGNGAASEAFNRIYDEWGEKIFNTAQF